MLLRVFRAAFLVNIGVMLLAGASPTGAAQVGPASSDNIRAWYQIANSLRPLVVE